MSRSLDAIVCLQSWLAA